MKFEKQYKKRLNVASDALSDNMTSVNLIMSITVYFPQTESLRYLFSLVVIMIPIPLLVHRLFDKVKERFVKNSLPGS